MSKNKNRKGLLLKSETLRALTGPALDGVVGGQAMSPVSTIVSTATTTTTRSVISACPSQQLCPSVLVCPPPSIGCITGAK